MKVPPRCAAKYKVERLIATGGFGGVVVATQVELGRRVAIKFLFGGRLIEDESVKRFLAEARVTASLAHANIVRVLDHDVEDGTPWIVYELLPGDTLHNLIQEGPVEWREGCRILAQVAAGIAHAHDHDVVHRDIKSMNVLDAGGGLFKVVDFGLCKFKSSATALTATGTLMGTPHYMAPEYLRGNPPTGATDVYALGILLFETIVGQMPFHGSSVPAILQAHLMAPVPRVRAILPDAPAELEEIVMATMSKLPADRPTARELSRQLEALSGSSVLERADTLAVWQAPGDGAAPEVKTPPVTAEGSRTMRRSRKPLRAGPKPQLAPAVHPVPPRITSTRLAMVSGMLMLLVLLGVAASRVHPPGSVPPPATATASSTVPPLRAALPADLRATLLTERDAIDTLRNRKKQFGAALKKTFSVGGLTPLALADVEELAKTAREFRAQHEQAMARCEAAMKRVKTSHPDLAGTPVEDLCLLSSFSVRRMTSLLQSLRAIEYSTRLEEIRASDAAGTASGLAVVDRPACYPVRVLATFFEEIDLQLATIARLDSGKAAPPGYPGMIGGLHSIGGHFRHAGVCGIPREVVEQRVVERLRSSQPATAGGGGGKLRELACHLWSIGLREATSPEARSLLARADARIEELSARWPATRQEFQRQSRGLHHDAAAPSTRSP